MASGAYSFGRWIGERPSVITAAIVALVCGAIYLSTERDDQVIEEATRIAQGATETLPPKLPPQCSDRSALLAKYQQLSEEKKHWSAATALRPCLTQEDAEFSALVAQAELSDAKATANDKNAPTSHRELAIERIEKMAPTEAASFAKLKAQLASKAAAESKAAARAAAALKKKQGVSIGMSQDDVIASSWGRPESINKSIYSFGVHEQWVYGGRNYLYFKNGVLDSIQTGN